MSEPQITLDPNSLNPVEEKLRGPLQEQLSSALQAATEKIRQTYAGESVDEVARMLLERTREGLHPDIAEGFRPDIAQLRQVAEAIVTRA
jgi:F0F1-type ATP synthase delta subunit